MFQPANKDQGQTPLYLPSEFAEISSVSLTEERRFTQS